MDQASPHRRALIIEDEIVIALDLEQAAVFQGVADVAAGGALVGNARDRSAASEPSPQHMNAAQAPHAAAKALTPRLRSGLF